MGDSISVDLVDNTGKVISKGKYEEGDRISVDVVKNGEVVSKGTYTNANNNFQGGGNSSSSSKNNIQNTSNVQESENLQKIKGGLNQEAYNQVLINADVEAQRKGQKVILDYDVGVGFYTTGTGEKYDNGTKKESNSNWSYRAPNENNSLLNSMGINNNNNKKYPQTSTEINIISPNYNNNNNKKESNSNWSYRTPNENNSLLSSVVEKNKNINSNNSIVEFEGKKFKEDKYGVYGKDSIRIEPVKQEKHEDVARMDYIYNRLTESGTIFNSNMASPYHNFATDFVSGSKYFYGETDKLINNYVSPAVSLAWEYNPFGMTMKTTGFIGNTLNISFLSDMEKSYKFGTGLIGDYVGGFSKTIIEIPVKIPELYIRTAYEGAIGKDFLEGKIKRTDKDISNYNIPFTSVSFGLPKEVVDYSFLSADLSLNVLAIGGGFYSGYEAGNTRLNYDFINYGGRDAYITASGLGAGIGLIVEGGSYLSNPSSYNYKEGLSNIAKTSGSMAGYVGVAQISGNVGFYSRQYIEKDSPYIIGQKSIFAKNYDNKNEFKQEWEKWKFGEFKNSEDSFKYNTGLNKFNNDVSIPKFETNSKFELTPLNTQIVPLSATPNRFLTRLVNMLENQKPKNEIIKKNNEIIKIKDTDIIPKVKDTDIIKIDNEIIKTEDNEIIKTDDKPSETNNNYNYKNDYNFNYKYDFNFKIPPIPPVPVVLPSLSLMGGGGGGGTHRNKKGDLSLKLNSLLEAINTKIKKKKRGVKRK